MHEIKAHSEGQPVALVTGAAGFIGFHVSLSLLSNGWKVIGLDSMSSYYDVSLKKSRESILLKNSDYKSVHKKVESEGVLQSIFDSEKPNLVIHLAAQAGVRYSIENPRSYLESNVIGTFELLEAARAHKPSHMLIASTSSAYGANSEMPYKETHRADHQISFYASTKKATESMAHSYSHLYNLPITVFRFFTVYGPWGRPDMAIFKFTKAMLKGKKIDVYNFGNMRRDFTYIDDLVSAITSLINKIPEDSAENPIESKSPVAPFRVVNIGNSTSEKLSDFIDALETSLGIEAQKNFMPMQAGDVLNTWADTSLLEHLTGYKPTTDVRTGVSKFVEWYLSYYKIQSK